MQSRLACLFLASVGGAHADVIQLTNGDVLTGKITHMGKDGTTIQSSVSASPLEIHAEAIESMTFPSEGSVPKPHSEQITLANGDTLPCKVLSMDQDKVAFSTWYAGQFTVPRQQVTSLRFGLSQERLIYTATEEPSEWDSTSGQWRLKDGVYTGKGIGQLARELDLPDNVRFRFDLAWQDTPNFVFRFCASTDAAQTKQNTYEFLFNTAGMQIKRIVKDQHPALLANIDLKPHDVKSRKLSIDLRVNRVEGTILLYIDGHKTATCTDTFTTADGNHIIFNNRASRGTTALLSNIKVSDWNDGEPSRFQTKIIDSVTDVLVDSEGEKISGHIASISGGEGRRMIQLDVKHATKPLMVPDRRISSLYFAKAKNVTPYPKSTFTAHLHGSGSVQLNQARLDDGSISANHPILGQFTLKPEALRSIAQSK